MAKLVWSLKDEETLVAKGDDTGVEFTIVAGRDDYVRYLLRSSGRDIDIGSSMVELMLAAQDIEDRTSEPDVTEGAGYAENH